MLECHPGKKKDKVVDLKDIASEGLENSRSIGQTKSHHQVFDVAEGSVEGGFPFISLLYLDQMIGIP